MHAIIEDSGTQIKVAEGNIIKIDPRELAEDAATVTFDRPCYQDGSFSLSSSRCSPTRSIARQTLDRTDEPLAFLRLKRKRPWRP